jgi:hypothetical protein
MSGKTLENCANPTLDPPGLDQSAPLPDPCDAASAAGPCPFTFDGLLPEAPALSVLGSKNHVALVWTAAAPAPGRAVTGYRIWDSTDGESFTLALTVPADVRSFDVTKLVKRTSYWFRVDAEDDLSVSPPSLPVSVEARHLPKGE